MDSLKASQEPQRVLRTLLFTDVRGFTSYTERRKPEQVVEVLNRLLEKQSEIIQKSGGDIDKFVGDEIVAIYSGDDAPRRACTAALRIVRLCAESSEEFDHLAVGAGIATGSVIHGMIGSLPRADFTVIGDSVNVASRLCGIAKGMQIVVSEATNPPRKRNFSSRGRFPRNSKEKINLNESGFSLALFRGGRHDCSERVPSALWTIGFATSRVWDAFSCVAEKPHEYATPDYHSWKRTTDVVLDYPIPGHQNRFRIPRMNDVGFTVKPTLDNGKRVWDFPVGTVIVKEVYRRRNPPQASSPSSSLLWLRLPRILIPRAAGLWITRDLPNGKEAVFMGNFCITCHANANEKHPYGDGNPDEEFRDYVYFVPGERGSGSRK